jgi:hypothetical protein
MLKDVECVLTLGKKHTRGSKRNSDSKEVREGPEIGHSKLVTKRGDDVMEKNRG